MPRLVSLPRIAFLLAISLLPTLWGASTAELVQGLRTATGFAGGLVVQLGCGDGELLAELGKQENVLALGLTADAAAAKRAQERLHKLGLYGRVSVRHWDGPFLPLVDNLANLVLVTTPVSGLARAELQRATVQDGAVCTLVGEKWQVVRKPRPAISTTGPIGSMGRTATRWPRTIRSSRRAICSGWAARSGRATMTAWPA